jgi:hypothetical protein
VGSDGRPRPTLITTPWPTFTPLPTAEGPAQMHLELEGQAGGAVNGVAVSGTHAYLTVGGRLQVLDVSDPAHPKLLGETPPLGAAAGQVAAHGDWAYVDTDRAVSIVNVQDPYRPQAVASLPLDGTVSQLAVMGDSLAALVLYGDGPAALRLVDIRQPAMPRLAAFLDLRGRLRSFWAETDGSLWLYANPPWSSEELPRVVGQDPEAEDGASPAGLRHIDVRDPDRPRDIPVRDLALAANGDRVHALAVDGQDAILAGVRTRSLPDGYDWHFRLRRVDTRPMAGPTPTAVEWVDEADYGDDSDASWYAFRHGDRLLIVGRSPFVMSDGSALRSFDLSRPDSLRPMDLSRPGSLRPIEVGATLWRRWEKENGFQGPPVLSGDLLYAPFASGLRIYDLADDIRPREVGAYEVAAIQPLVLVGDVLWSAEESCCTDQGQTRRDLRSYHLDAPGALTVLGGATWPEDIRAVAADDSLLVGITRDGDLYAFDIRDPAHPVPAGTVERSTERAKACAGATTQHCGPGLVTGAELLGSLLVVGYWEVGLEFIEVTHPPQPFEVRASRFNEEDQLYGGAGHLAAKGSTVWSSDQWHAYSWDLDRRGLAGFLARAPSANSDRAAYCLGALDGETAVAGEAEPYPGESLTLQVYQRPHGQDAVQLRGEVPLLDLRPDNANGVYCSVLADGPNHRAFVDQYGQDGYWLNVVDLSDLDHPRRVVTLAGPPLGLLAVWRDRLITNQSGGLTWWRVMPGSK